MYLSSSTKYFVMYLGTCTSTFLKLKYKVQASTQKNVGLLKYRQVQVPLYLAPTLFVSTSRFHIMGHSSEKETIWGVFCPIPIKSIYVMNYEYLYIV